MRSRRTGNAFNVIRPDANLARFSQSYVPNDIYLDDESQQIIIITGPNALLSALCRTISGSSNSTSLSLNNISNDNGTLQQQ